MDIKRVIENYWNFRSKTYNTDLIDNSQLIRFKWKNMLSEKIGHRENLKVLDIGTGPGFLALLFAEMQHEVHAVDLSLEMLYKACTNANNKNLNIDFYHADAENLAFKNEYFDVIVNKYLLWTLPEPVKALSEWKRVLKKGGKIISIDGEWHNDNKLSAIFSEIFNLKHIFLKNNYFFEYRKSYGSIKHSLPLYKLKQDAVLQSFNEVGFNDINVESIDENLVAEDKPVYCISGIK